MSAPSRRRVLRLAAGAVTGGLLAGGWWAASGRRRADGALHRFRFQALGAEAESTLPGSRDRAAAAVADLRLEIERIERAVSLHRPDSALARLNRDGRLPAPPEPLRALMARAAEIGAATDGGFDPTIQPIWRALAAGEDSNAAARLVDGRRFRLTRGAAGFDRPGMAASFNGIAQGYAADRAVAVLARWGYRDALADLGETRALGARPDGEPWRVGVADPRDGRIRATLNPGAGAVATSAPRATLIGGRPHIFDPLARPGPRWVSVTVAAEEGWRADALSTTIAAAPAAQASDLLARGGATEAVFIAQTGALNRWRA